MIAQPDALSERLSAYKKQNPKSRTRDCAAALGVAEAQLLALGCDNGVTRLSGDWRELLKDFEGLGLVMALTRNEYAVHEKKGLYREVSFEGMMGMALDKDIDLRLFMRHWAKGFAVEEETITGKRYSFHFFDSYGTALHKVYLQDNTNVDHFRGLVESWASSDQSRAERVERKPDPETERPDSEIDVESLRAGWEAMTNTHEFIHLLRDHKVSRTQALRLVGADKAVKLHENTAHRFVLQRAADTETPLMIFIGSPGCVQIHTGTVNRLVQTDGWYNVLDPTFNLHLRERGIAESWIVKKPTEDGIITSLELFDSEGETIMLVFGSRKETITENPAWRNIMDALSEDERFAGEASISGEEANA